MNELTLLAETFGLECHEINGKLYALEEDAEGVINVLKTLGLTCKLGERLPASLRAHKQIFVIPVILKNVDLALKVAGFWKRVFARGNYAVPNYPDPIFQKKCESMGIKSDPGENFWDVYKGYVSMVASHYFLAEGAIINFLPTLANVASQQSENLVDASEPEVEEDVE